MSVYSYSRRELRHLTARLCNDLVTGTVATPSSGSFVCTERDWQKPDDYFNDWVDLYCYYGTGKGTSGNPTDWVNSTHTLSFLPAATLTAGDLVELHQRFTVDEYNDWLNMAIELSKEDSLIDYVDTSIELEADTYQYLLPSELRYISKIEMESGTSGLYDQYKPIDGRDWRIVNSSDNYLEFVKERWTPTDGRYLRVTGLATHSKLNTDADNCTINPNYIINQAAALLHQSRIRGDDVDSEYHRGQMVLCQGIADRIRATMKINLGSATPVGVN